MGILNHYLVQVDWGDCDPAGIVFYPNFYRWMDRGFWLLFESRSLTLEALKRRFGVFGGPLVDYKRNLRFSCTHGRRTNGNELYRRLEPEKFSFKT